MQKEARHIIHRLNLDVDVPDMATALRIHDQVLELIYNEVLPQLEAVLQRNQSEEIYWHAQAVDLNLDFDSETAFYNTMASKASTALAGSVAVVLPTKTEIGETSGLTPEQQFEQVPVAEKRMSIFLFFLQTGRLPWHAAAFDSWMEEAPLMIDLKTMTFTEKSSLVQLLTAQPPVVHRLVAQFTPAFIGEFLALLLEINLDAGLKKTFATTIALSAKARMGQVKELTNAITAMLQNEVHDSKLPVSDFKEIGLPEQTVDTPKKANLSAQEEEKDKGVFVANAGLILLHPYLLYFFRELHLVKEQQFINDTAQQTAVHLLHFLATGTEQPFEHELYLEKQLCAWPADKPVDRFIRLSKTMKQESEQLLQSVIQNWNKLKNASPASLQEAFLQRNGKYITGFDRDRLIVETNALDILLDYLPWNYTIIALPWRKKILYVDWVKDA